MQSIKKNKVKGITLPGGQDYCIVPVFMVVWAMWREMHRVTAQNRELRNSSTSRLN